MSESIRVVLIRLCECEGNLKNLACQHGRLTDIGRHQALATRRRIIGLGIQGWYAPDNSACKETAAVLSGGVLVQNADEFHEPPYPEWSGMTLEQIKNKWPSEWESYRNPQPGDEDQIIVPGGESLRTTYERAKSGLDRLYVQMSGGSAVAIVTHGEVVRLITVGLLEAPLTNLFRLRGRNGAITVFDYDQKVARFDCVNDASHLAGLTPKDLWDYM
jgi:broad specificity phosphatase PhoE